MRLGGRRRTTFPRPGPPISDKAPAGQPASEATDRQPDIPGRRAKTELFAFGVGGGLAVSQLSGMAVVVTPSSIVLAFAVAAAVGILFGWYPARTVAAMKPIDALRYQ